MHSFASSLHRYLGIGLQLSSFNFKVHHFRWRNVNDFLFLWVLLLNLHCSVIFLMTTKKLQPIQNFFFFLNPVELYHSNQRKLSFHSLFHTTTFQLFNFQNKNPHLQFSHQISELNNCLLMISDTFLSCL